MDPDPSSMCASCSATAPSTSQVSPPQRIELEDDSVYWLGQRSFYCFTGSVGFDLSDEEVLELVQYYNPRLYARLWGHSTESSESDEIATVNTALENMDVDASDECAAMPNDSQHPHSSRSSPLRLAGPSATVACNEPHEEALVAEEQEFPQTTTGVLTSLATRPEHELRQDLQLLQLRRFIQFLLLSECI